MANLASLIVKIGANDAEIQKSLEKLGQTVKRTDADFKKLGNTPMAQQAQKSLETLNATVKQVTDSHQRLADRATAMGRAFTSGVISPARLTKTELDQVNRSLQAGLEAFRALGQRAPADLQKVAAAVQQQQLALSGTTASAGLLASAFGRLTAAFTLGNLLARAVSSLSAWTTEAVRSASTIVDLSNKTGLSTATIQRFAFVASQTGTSVEAFSDAAFKLSARIGGGSGSVVRAVEALGLSFAQLRSLSPDEQFATVAKALENVTDTQERSTLALAVGGRAAGTILPAIAEGYTKLAAQATVAGDDQIKALDKASDRWDKWVTDRKTNITSFLGSLILLKERTDELSQVPGGSPFRAQSLLKESPFLDPRRVPTVSKGTGADINLGPTIVVLRNYQKELQQAREDVAALTANERAEIFAAQELGESVGELADRFGLSEAALGLLSKTTKTTTTAMTEAEKAAEAFRLELERHTAAAKQVELSLRPLGELGGFFEAAIDPAVKVRLQLVELERSATVGIRSIAQTADQIVNSVDQAVPPVNRLKSALASMAQVAIAAGSSLVSALGQRAGFGAGANAALGISTSLAGSALAASGMFAATTAGAVALGAATLGIGAAAVGVIALVKHLNGASKEFRELRAQADQLINGAGGINELAQRAFDAGTEISTLLSVMNSDNPARLRAELERLNAAFEFQDRAMQTLDDTVAKYNFTIEERGPAIALREQIKLAEQLHQDWRVLIAAGVDVAAVAREMAGSTNLYVQNALKMGQEIPEFMRDQILKMIQLGLLYDQNGVKITSLEGSGITFSQTMTANVDRIILKIQALIEAIDRGLGNVIRNVPDLVVDVRYNDPGWLPPNPANPGPREDPSTPSGFAQGGMVTPFGIQHFARGGRVLPFLRRGSDTIPAMLTPGEMVLNRSQQDAIRGALGEGRGPIVMQVVLDRRVIAEAVLDETNSGGASRSKFNSLVRKAG